MYLKGTANCMALESRSSHFKTYNQHPNLFVKLLQPAKSCWHAKDFSDLVSIGNLPFSLVHRTFLHSVEQSFFASLLINHWVLKSATFSISRSILSPIIILNCCAVHMNMAFKFYTVTTHLYYSNNRIFFKQLIFRYLTSEFTMHIVRESLRMRTVLISTLWTPH